LDLTEYLTYEHINFNQAVINFGENSDCTYFLLDGTVTFNVDLRKRYIGDSQVNDLCNDLTLNKKELVKRIVEFKEITGINKEQEGL